MIIYKNDSLNDFLTNIIINSYLENNVDAKLMIYIKENGKIITPTRLASFINGYLKEKYSTISQADLMRLGLKDLSYQDYIDTCEFIIKSKVGKGLIGEVIVHYLLFECGYLVTKDFDKDVYNKIDFVVEGDKDKCNIQVKTIKSIIDNDSKKDEIDLEKSYQLSNSLQQKIEEEKALNKYTHKYYHVIVNEKYFKKQRYYQRDVYIMLDDNSFVNVYSFNNLTPSTVTQLNRKLIEDIFHLNRKEEKIIDNDKKDNIVCSKCGDTLLKYYLSDKDKNVFCSEKCAFNFYQLSINSDGPQNYVKTINEREGTDFTF